MIEEIDTRTKLLLGDDFEKLASFKIAIIGLGGVGSIVPISLIRSGFENLIIVDGDRVDITNLNRQIAYDTSDIGKFKAEILKEKLLKIRPNAKIQHFNTFIDENFDFNVFSGVDFIIDCIDDIEAKVLLASFCEKNNINLVCSMGTGNRLNPSALKIVRLDKTCNDPLAKKFRYLLRKNNLDLKRIFVASSEETPIIKDKVVSSMAFVPNSCGLLLASYVLRYLLRRSL